MATDQWADRHGAYSVRCPHNCVYVVPHNTDGVEVNFAVHVEVTP